MLRVRFASQLRSEIAIKIWLKFPETNDKNLQASAMQLSEVSTVPQSFEVGLIPPFERYMFETGSQLLA